MTGRRWRRRTGGVVLVAAMVGASLVTVAGRSGAAPTTTTSTSTPSTTTTTLPASTTTTTTPSPTPTPAPTTTTTTTAPRRHRPHPTTTTTGSTTTTTARSKTPTTGVPKVPTGGGAAKPVKPPKGPAAPAGAAAAVRAVTDLEVRIDAADAVLALRRQVTTDERTITVEKRAVAARQATFTVDAGAARRAGAAVAAARGQLSKVAVAVYTGSTYIPPASVEPGAPGPLGTRGEEADDADIVIEVILQHDERAEDATEQAMRRAETVEAAASAAASRAGATLARDSSTLVAAEKRVTSGVAAAKTVRPPSKVTGAGPTILGPALADASDLAAWYATTGEHPATTVPIRTLAADYAAAGRSTGVRADLAFAQSVVETGYFSFPSGGQLVGKDNNFAGIGACDSCAHGWSFPTARTGVGTQLELLEVYASTHPVRTPLLHGTVGIGGCCTTWMSLAGHWATSTTYGVEILGVYDRILTWLLPRRLAAAGIS